MQLLSINRILASNNSYFLLGYFTLFVFSFFYLLAGFSLFLQSSSCKVFEIHYS